jgi:hypothetical protein
MTPSSSGGEKGGSMKKLIVSLAVAVGVTMPMVAPAFAADLGNGSSQSCSGLAVWHFVNNQTGPAAAGTLTAQFNVDGAATFYVVDASAVNKSTQHFYVTTEGDAVLVTASTNLPGRLLLSDLACDTTPKKK